MKKKLLALACALCLCVSLAGCTLSTPASVGSIGEIEIPAGIYLLAQYQAYQNALSAANTNQQSMTAARYLKQQIPLTEDGQPDAAANALPAATATPDPSAASGSSSEAAEATPEPAVTPAPTPDDTRWVTVSDYVAGETRRSLQYYAAVETRFAQLGGELTAEEITQADSYAQQLWDNYGDTYTANGIGLNTVRQYEYNYFKAIRLLTLVYGAEGETPVSDETLTGHLQQDMFYGYYVVVPMYNTSTFAFADDTQTADMLTAAQQIVDAYTALQQGGSAGGEGVADEPKEPAAGEAGAEDGGSSSGSQALLANFYTALEQGLPTVYSVLGGEYDPSSQLSGDLGSNLFTRSELESSFSEEAQQVVTGLQFGEAAAVQYNALSLIIFVRADPLESHELEDLRSSILNDMKGEELSESLYAYGADELADHLDAAAMNKLPAKKIASAG